MTTPAPAAGPDYPCEFFNEYGFHADTMGWGRPTCHGPDYPTPGDATPAPHQGDDLAFARDTADARGDGCLALAAQLEESEEARALLARRVVALTDQVARVEALHHRDYAWAGAPSCAEDGGAWPCATYRALRPSSPTLDSARAVGDQQEDAVAEGGA